MGLLTAGEQQELIELLLKLPGIIDPQVRQLLVLSLPASLQQIIAHSPMQRIDITNIVATADSEAAQQADGFWPIVSVIESAISLVPGAQLAADLQQLLDTSRARPEAQPQSPARPAAGADRFETCHVFGQQVFVDRRRLRAYIRELCTDAGVRTLAIDGSPQTGKTYSFQLIQFLTDDRERYDVKLINLANYDYPGFKASDLAEEIGLLLGIGLDSMPAQNDPATSNRWAMKFGAWLVGKVQRSDTARWLVFDNIPPRGSARGEAIDLLLKELLQRVHGGLDLRLVLLGYKNTEIHTLDTPISSLVRYEQISEVDPLDLRAFFARHLQCVGKPSNAADISQAVDQVIRAVADGDSRNPAKLWPALHQFLQSQSAN